MANKDKQETDCNKIEATTVSKTDSTSSANAHGNNDGNKLHKSKSENDKVISDDASTHSTFSHSNKSISNSMEVKDSTKVNFKHFSN